MIENILLEGEEWRDIPEFPGYQVSNKGRIRSFWQKKKKTGCWGGYYRFLTDKWYILKASDDGNGYLKVFLQNDVKRRCVKVHRLVAEAFIPKPDDKSLDTVDHIKSGPEGKLDNTVENLRWMSRRENIQKAYKDGMCDSRIKRACKEVYLEDLNTGKRRRYSSIKAAAEAIGVDRSSISHILMGDIEKVSHYKAYSVDSRPMIKTKSSRAA